MLKKVDKDRARVSVFLQTAEYLKKKNLFIYFF